jgi:hypothetical protein
MGKIWDLRNKKGKFKKFRSTEYPKGLSKDNKRDKHGKFKRIKRGRPKDVW